MRRSAMLAIAIALAGGTAAHAGILGGAPKVRPEAVDAAVNAVQQALDEQRWQDAGRYLDTAQVSGVQDPRLVLLGGELNLARRKLNGAMSRFQEAEASPVTRARALQGQGIVLSLMGRSDPAVAMLQRAVAEDPAAWRAWNALGSEYDSRGRWAEAEDAYAKAMASSDAAAQVFNNRGYSRLLQHRRDEAVADFVAALQKRPDMAEARTNLRLALAMHGDYDRAVVAGGGDDQAALLNNAGFAAGMRGDYAQAEDLLNRAMASRGEFYGRASENLKLIRGLASKGAKADAAP